MKLKEKLMKINEELKSIKWGELPDDPIEEDIYLELDQTESYIASKFPPYSKNNFDFNPLIVNQSKTYLNKLIKRRTKARLRKNKVLFKRCVLVLEALDTMEKLTKKE